MKDYFVPMKTAGGESSARFDNQFLLKDSAMGEYY
jgi:hypothetical protein